MTRIVAHARFPPARLLAPAMLLACTSTTASNNHDTGAGSGSSGDVTSTGGVGATSDGSTTAESTTHADASTESSESGEPSTACERDDAVTVVTTDLDPQLTDPEISPGFDHVVVDPPGTVANRLFVFLPGTGGPPGGYRHILRNAAAGGYHALGLAYRNEVAVNDLCTVAEHGCHAAVREEILTGEDLSPLVEVGRADSIEHRLSAALVHLGWEQYLDGDALRWSDIAVAGHSQGGGHAAFIASLHEVHRASLFAASEPAHWTGEALATPAARIYGFIHVDDPYYASMTSSWERLGIPGALVDVDGLAWPFEDSHRLQTTFAVSAEDAHGAVAADPRTPMDGDLPVYRDVWCAVIGP